MLLLRTYADLHRITNVFAAGDYNLCMLIGKPGHGKSQIVREAVEASGEQYYPGLNIAH